MRLGIAAENGTKLSPLPRTGISHETCRPDAESSRHPRTVVLMPLQRQKDPENGQLVNADGKLFNEAAEAVRPATLKSLCRHTQGDHKARAPQRGDIM